jgi:putative ABC transport system permease protein
MLINIIKRSFLNQKRAMALMVISVAVGTAMAASLITISLEISEKVSRELRAFGANILVEPKVEGLADISGQKRYLRQEDVIKTKTIFWRHNIVGVSPILNAEVSAEVNSKHQRIDAVGLWYSRELPLPGEKKTFTAGVSSVSPWWNVDGEWPDKDRRVMLGISLSEGLGISKGDRIFLDKEEFLVAGIIETGGAEDDQAFMMLESLQDLMGLEGKISRVMVSAMTTPMDDFAYKDPETMTKVEYEKWYCTGYVTSIAKQLEEVFQGSRAKPIWQVAESEGKILGRLRLLIYFLSSVALIASALGVSTTMIMSLLRRTEELGLMKAIGADSSRIISIFLSEGAVIGLIGGFIGYLLSIAVAEYIGIKVFDTGFEQKGLLFPVSIGSAIIISITGIILPIKKALGIKPGIVLKGAE